MTIVRTQAELDAALADSSVTEIDIDSPRGVWLEIGTNDKYVRASDEAVGITGSPYDTAKIKARSCVVLHEVDINGREIAAAVTA